VPILEENSFARGEERKDWANRKPQEALESKKHGATMAGKKLY